MNLENQTLKLEVISNTPPVDDSSLYLETSETMHFGTNLAEEDAVSNRTRLTEFENGFNTKIALELAKLSAAAYEPFEFDDSISLKLQLKNLGFSLLQTFTSPITGTQAYLAHNGECAVLSFRGTEREPCDILTDLKVNLDLELGGHRGFFEAYNSISAQVQASVTNIGDKPLYITGHSLGGALATVAALNLKRIGKTQCYTYGAPPICTAVTCSKMKVSVYQIIDAGDIVPRAIKVGTRVGGAILLILRLFKVFFRYKYPVAKTLILDTYISTLQAINSDLEKYDYFPDPYWINEEGLAQWLGDSNDSYGLFLKILTKNWQRCIRDHRIESYISALESKNNKTEMTKSSICSKCPISPN